MRTMLNRIEYAANPICACAFIIPPHLNRKRRARGSDPRCVELVRQPPWRVGACRDVADFHVFLDRSRDGTLVVVERAYAELTR